MMPMSRRFQSTRFAVTLGVLTVVAAGCGSLGEPYLGSFPTSSVPAEVSRDDGADSADGTALPIGDVAIEALPPRPADYVPSIVVVTGNGLGVIERTLDAGSVRFSDLEALNLSTGSDSADSETTSTTAPEFGFDNDEDGGDAEVTTTAPPVSIPWTTARDDLFGGLVLQSSDGEMMWFPGTGGEARTISSEGDLLEVGYSAGTPEALIDRNGQLDRIRLIDNDVTVFIELAPGEDIIDVSSAGGVVAVAKGDGGCGSVDFVAADGSELAIDPFGQLVCLQTSRPNVGAVAMSPDGEAVAFTIIKYRGDGVELETELFAVELTTGADILTAPVGGSGEVVESLAFDGTTAVLLRRSSASSEVVVADSESVQVLDLAGAGVPRSVTFARLPLSPNLGR